MCGIAGLVGDDLGSPERARALASAMIDTLAHRGPDGDGVEVVSTRVVLAHRLLAVIDTTVDGHQPMASRSGRWTITYNGEIYNHRALRADLALNGTVFRGHSDTETLVEAIDAWGIDTTLDRVNGMFAFAAFDSTADRLVVARDRLGEKPLYWWASGSRFAFASELRALRRHPDLTLDIDPAAVASLLRWSFIPHPNTIYAGVRQLAPGTLLDVSTRGGRLDISERTWWSLGDAIADGVASVQPTTVEAAAAELEPLLADAVATRMESEVPLGAFLSGGIDSSVVAALAQAASGSSRLTTFTVSMPDIGFDESAHAAAVAAHLGTDHHDVHLSPSDAFDVIPRLADVWDEPFADPSMLPTLLLCGAARRHLTVCLGGDGGDEMFAGYNRHVHGAPLAQRVSRIPAPLRRGMGRVALAPSPATVDRWARRIPSRRMPPNVGDKMQKLGAMLHADGGAWDTLAGVWSAADLGVDPYAPCLPAAISSTLRSTPGTGSLDPVAQMMAVDTAAVLPDQMLVKTDRASMAASLEVRAPLLDHRVLEWAWRQPSSVKSSGGVGKLVLRRVAADLLPPSITARPKMGFDPPLARWLRGELRPWAADLLASPRCVEEGWIAESAVAAAWSEHQAGDRNRDAPLWGVLMLESWLAEHHA